jgi:hypothetical protein
MLTQELPIDWYRAETRRMRASRAVRLYFIRQSSRVPAIQATLSPIALWPCYERPSFDRRLVGSGAKP